MQLNLRAFSCCGRRGDPLVGIHLNHDEINGVARDRRSLLSNLTNGELLMRSINNLTSGPLNYRTAARTLFLRPYLAHFCSFLRHIFAVLSVLTPGIQKVAPKDRGPAP